MTEASLDDLLRHETEPPRRAATGFGIGWWLRNLAVAAGLTASSVVGLRFYGLGVSAVAVFAAVLALLLLRRVSAQLAPPAAARQPLRLPQADDGSYRFGEQDGLRRELRRWERRLQWAHREPERFRRALRPVLIELVDERLRQRRGITLAGDPARARALLGEPLWALLHGQLHRTPTQREYAEILARLENL
ncbi:MAG TPA: hypothetical protein VF174_13945 [Micromonosporaceae bacterium]